ncbi:DUF6057 family protein [Bacteroides sedimenti]
MYYYNSHADKKTNRTISIVSGLFFWIFSMVYLSVNYRFLLTLTEDFSLFIFSLSFFNAQISQPGGVLRYLSGFFVQFLNNPWLGAFIITLFLQLIQWLVHKSFDFNRKYFILSYIPCFLLLVIATNAGRPFYLMAHIEMIFTYILGVFILMISYFLFSKIEKQNKRFITLCWLIPLLFFGMSGSIAICFITLIFLETLFSVKDQNKMFTYLLCVALFIVSYLVARFLLYSHCSDLQIMFGMRPVIPTTQTGEEKLPHVLLWCFFIFAVVKQRFIPFGNRINSYSRWTYTNIIWLILFCLATVTMANGNDDFMDEMAIDHFIQKRDFTKALQIGKDAQHPTREMTVLRNFALELSGRAGDEMFEYVQDYKTDGLFFDYNKDGGVYPTGPVIYFNLGARHLATQWANNDYLKRPDSYRVLKNYVLIATVNEHWNVTQQTAGILENTWFHNDLASKLNKFSLDNSLVNKDPILGNIKKRLSNKYYPFPTKGNYTDFVCKFYRENPENRVAYDYYLLSALLNKKLDKFAWGVKLYNNYYKNLLPKHYAEAVSLCKYLTHDSLLVVNPATQQKFEAFLMLKKEQKDPTTEKNIMRKSYGDTYWWYYMYK